MAKRFVDTKLFDDSWFMELTPNNKLFFIYLITNCDHAGIIDLNIKLAEFKTGIKGLSNGLATVEQEFGNRLVSLRNNYYFLPKFVKYQYPKGLNEKVNAQKSVINRLVEFNLFNIKKGTVGEGFSNSWQTVQDKDKDLYKDLYKDLNKDKDIECDKNELYIPLSEKMRLKIIEISPNAKISDSQIKQWSNTFRLMVEQDKKTYEFIDILIDDVYSHVGSNGFKWGDNIKSANKLREKLNEGKLDNIKNKQLNLFSEVVLPEDQFSKCNFEGEN